MKRNKKLTDSINVSGNLLFFVSDNMISVVSEIKEREEWFHQMEELGEGDKYKLVIQQQIQARVREMEKLKLEDSYRGGS
jgi:hypothetical protein